MKNVVVALLARAVYACIAHGNCAYLRQALENIGMMRISELPVSH